MYEHDSSVGGGKVVSPILSVTPETWRRLHQVCGIITRHGRTASPNNATTANSSRVESPLWDGSLEPGRIQAQVKMSTAMLDNTARNRDLVFPATSAGLLGLPPVDCATEEPQTNTLASARICGLCDSSRGPLTERHAPRDSSAWFRGT